jgi:hypothetical protein
MIGGSKLSNFKIGEPKLQNGKNMGTKTAINPIFFKKIITVDTHHAWSEETQSSMKVYNKIYV